MNPQLMANEQGFELIDDNQNVVGKIVWQLQDDVMLMNGTIVDPTLRGQNAGQQLLDAAAHYAREHDYKMMAICPYVVRMFEKSTAYDDVKA